MKSFFDFSERFGIRAGGYRDLMSRRVHHVLLVSSLYESFILAEDGHLHEAVLGEFVEASPRDPPDLTNVSSGAEVLSILERGGRPVDLVITSPDVGDMDAIALGEAIRRAGHSVPVAILAYDRDQLASLRTLDSPAIVGRFLYQGDARILLAIVQLVEDRENARRDTLTGVPVFLLVEDSIRFYSSFLPLVYREVQRLSDSVQKEAGNRLQRIMRARARPKVLLATTYERAYAVVERHRGSIMGVFADMRFPRGGEPDSNAGESLVRAIRSLEPDVPVALQSSHESNRAIAERLGVGFIQKGAPDFLAQVRAYLSSHLFFGDFVFRDEFGEEIDRATNLRELVNKLRSAPAESVAYHAVRHDFSRWLRARAEFGLAAKLRPRQVDEFDDVESLRGSLVEDIDRYRRERSRGSVVPFRAELFDGEEGLVQIGGGSLGGKGRGLAFASRLLDEVRMSERFPGVRVTVPAAVVLGTEVFDRFLDENDLRGFALQEEDQATIESRFLETPLPAEVVDQLRLVLEVVKTPLAVRSSSLLEDSPQLSLAGIYGTWLLPNDAVSAEVRLDQLCDAVRKVYASTFSARARTFIAATEYRLEEEAMAVIIQRLVGVKRGDRFYPQLSGVARSHNFYPAEPATTKDGIAAVALGLGKTVAGGDPCLRFAPPHPLHLPEHPSVEAMVERSQRTFWALRLGVDPAEVSRSEEGPLVRCPLKVAEQDGMLAPVASTYSAENHAIYDGLGRPGVRLVSFAPMLKHDVFPLADILTELLIVGTAGTRSPVEIEFAASLSAERGEPAEMAFLQLRPLALFRELSDVRIESADDRVRICESRAILGHGRIEGLRDVIVVDRDRFERGKSREAAVAVARMNARLVSEGRPYALIGVGRWGSTHPWLGIPVRWDEISGAKVIVEAGFHDFRVTPSQGTHFYQNLVSLGVGYMTVNEATNEGAVDWEYLAGTEELEQDGPVRRLRFDDPLLAVLNGRDRYGVLFGPETH